MRHKMYPSADFGLESQLNKRKEVLSELYEAISTYSESEDLDHLLEEIVDVNLVTDEVIILLSYKHNLAKSHLDSAIKELERAISHFEDVYDDIHYYEFEKMKE